MGFFPGDEFLFPPVCRCQGSLQGAAVPAMPNVQWEFSAMVRVLSHDHPRASQGGGRDAAWRRGPDHASLPRGRSLLAMPISLVEEGGLASPRVTESRVLGVCPVRGTRGPFRTRAWIDDV